jgi:hypothetical protein
MEKVREAARDHVEQVRSLLVDRLTRDQRTALREISEVLATGIVDMPKLISMGWPSQ